MNFDPDKVGEHEITWWKAHNDRDKEKMLEFLKKWIAEMYELSDEEAAQGVEYLVGGIRIHDEKHDTGDFTEAVDEIEKFYKMIAEKLDIEVDTRKIAEYEIKWWETHDKLEKSSDKSELEDVFAEQYAELLKKPVTMVRYLVELRTLATYEHDLAEDRRTAPEMIDFHWDRAEMFLKKFYTELKRLAGG